MRYFWQDWESERLLDVHLSQLNLNIEGSELESCIHQLYDELEQKGIVFKPPCYLSTDWYVCDGEVGIAIPYFLAHSRLVKLERKLLFEAEGSQRAHCMKLLRHEAGHAIDNAYKLRRFKKRQLIFGKASKPYPKVYQPRPRDLRFVVNLDGFYGQAHPDEDWAETFAVWLAPKSEWRRRFKGTPALEKLTCLDNILSDAVIPYPIEAEMKEFYILDSIKHNEMTLRQYFDEKRTQWRISLPQNFDHALKELFMVSPHAPFDISAALFLEDHRKLLRNKIAKNTFQYRYVIDRLIDDTIARCHKHRLYLLSDESVTRDSIVRLLSLWGAKIPL